MKMSDSFPYTDKFPESWINSCAIEREGVRWYTDRGSRYDFEDWYNLINDTYAGDLIPLSFVPEYTGVSRASVYKRAKRGGLTILSFIITAYKRSFMGDLVKRDTKKRYDMAIRSECDAWRRILCERASRSNRDVPNEDDVEDTL